MLSLGALGYGVVGETQVVLLLLPAWFRQSVKGLAFEPNQFQDVQLSLVHVLVLIKSSWGNIPAEFCMFFSCVGFYSRKAKRDTSIPL